MFFKKLKFVKRCSKFDPRWTIAEHGLSLWDQAGGRPQLNNDKIYTLENMGREISPGWASDDNEKENDKIYNVNDNCSGHGRKEIT